MFCRECGKEIPDDAKFCPGCGTALADEHFAPTVPEVDSAQPLLTLRPVFIPWVTVLSILPIQLFMTLWASLFCGGFSMFGAHAVGLDLPEWFTYVFFGCLAFFGIPLVVYVAKKRTYAKTEYRFYRDRLEYAEGFWTVENKITKYKSVIEVNFRKGIIQRRYNLGNLYLATAATGLLTQAGPQGVNRSGIRICDIEEPEKVYEMVQNLIA